MMTSALVGTALWPTHAAAGTVRRNGRRRVPCLSAGQCGLVCDCEPERPADAPQIALTRINLPYFPQVGDVISR